MSGVVVKVDASPIRPSTERADVVDVVFCPCDFRCDFEEKVFASDEGDGIKNDFSDFLFKKITSSDTITIQLIKNGIIVNTVSDDSLGMYYEGFDAQALYIGWQADWTKIFNMYSGGRYQVRAVTNILGEESTFNSRYFRLNIFDSYEANETVKIESFQSGNIDSSEFDFTNLIEGGWRSSIRLSGKFGNMQPSIEKEVMQDSSYRVVQNRESVSRQYKMICRFVPESIQDRISTRDVLSNLVYITSYDLLQELKYERYPVVPDSFNDVQYDGMGRSSFEITFSDRQQNIIKTNV